VNAETVLKVRVLVHANWWITIGEVANDGVLRGSLKAVLTDELLLTQLCSTFVLRVPTEDEKECWKTITSEWKVNEGYQLPRQGC
jgi:hypothetical protein